MIIVKNLTKKYGTKDKTEEVIALNNVSLVFPDTGFIAIYGASGCGKSTLLNVLGGLDQADTGEMIVNGRSTSGFTSHDWNSYRNQEVGFVFQNYFLLPHLNVFDNIAVTLQMAKQTDNLQEKIHNALNQVDLAKFGKRYPRQLSGGQQQRVAIARALIANPAIILTDEPTGALDEKSSKMVMKTLKDISKDHLVVMVTHNERMAKEYADRLIEISYGTIVSDTNPLTIDEVKVTEKDKLPEVHLPFKTSIKWSLRNIVKKKSRSIPIAIASGIGLAAAGIVLSMTQGINAFVERAQKEAIKDYPVYVTCHSKNSSEFNEINLVEFPLSPDIVIEKSDYKAQEHYITMQQEFIDHMNKNLVSGFDYEYVNTNSTIEFNLFAKPTEDSYTKIETTRYLTCITPETKTYDFLINDQYDVIAADIDRNSDPEGFTRRLPRNKNELTLVVDTYNRIDLGALQNMGFDTSGDSIKAEDIVGKIKDGAVIKEPKKYHVVSNDDMYSKDNKEVVTEEGTVTREIYKKSGTAHYQELYDTKSQLELKIVSIIRPKVGTTNPIYSNVLLYHPDLASYLIDENTGLNTQSNIVKEQKANTKWDVITGEDYKETFTNGYTLTEQYQRESRIVDLGGTDRVTAFFYYTKNFDQRNAIIKCAEEYPVDPDSNIIIKTKDYLESVTSSFSSLVRTFSVILLMFSLVSILVAAIMTAILTYISVIERKREIGLLRSLGARQTDVSLMFISEASLIGIGAGVLGVGLCYAFAPLVSRVVVSLIDVYNSKMLKPSPDEFSQVQFWLIPVLFAAAIAIGIIASLIPAIIAGRKKPAEALKE